MLPDKTSVVGSLVSGHVQNQLNEISGPGPPIMQINAENIAD
jgi:hypothetical protein